MTTPPPGSDAEALRITRNWLEALVLSTFPAEATSPVVASAAPTPSG